MWTVFIASVGNDASFPSGCVVQARGLAIVDATTPHPFTLLCRFLRVSVVKKQRLRVFFLEAPKTTNNFCAIALFPAVDGLNNS